MCSWFCMFNLMPRFTSTSNKSFGAATRDPQLRGEIRALRSCTAFMTSKPKYGIRGPSGRLQLSIFQAANMGTNGVCSGCIKRLVASTSSRVPSTSIARYHSRLAPHVAGKTRRTEIPSRRFLTRDAARQQQAAAQVSRQDAQAPPQMTDGGEDRSRLLLRPNNLFHSFTNSPSPEIRKRAAFMRQNAYCPHPAHQQTRQTAGPSDQEAKKGGAVPPAHVRYECPDCGIPVSCSEEHFTDDYESHLEICDVLRQINEDDHDLRSGRFFPEFEYPPDQIDEAQVNMTNWDTLLYSRQFNAINDERPLRQATRLLTYPMTIGSVLHELSPYDIKRGGRLTVEGLKSLSGMFLHLFPHTSL